MDGSTQGQRRRPRILLGVTGSVAAVKAPELAVRLVQQQHAEVKVLLTVGGRNFWEKAHEYDAAAWSRIQQLLTASCSDATKCSVEIHYAQDEWKAWDRLGDPVEHIDLRNWADILLIAPLSAHTLAKIANGLCDDTLSCVARAWDFKKPMILAPAMNTAMWEHTLTHQQLEAIQSWGKEVSVVQPQSKLLACGEFGNGALASVNDIVDHVQRILNK